MELFKNYKSLRLRLYWQVMKRDLVHGISGVSFLCFFELSRFMDPNTVVRTLHSWIRIPWCVHCSPWNGTSSPANTNHVQFKPDGLGCSHPEKARSNISGRELACDPSLKVGLEGKPWSWLTTTESPS